MRHLFVTLTAAVALAQTTVAQPVPVERLSNPVASFEEPFSRIVGVRELSDGRVMLADRLEQAIRVLDLKTGSMGEIGRVGGGPGEFQMPGGLLPLPGDRALLIDFGNTRLTQIEADGRFSSSTSMMLDNSIFARPTGADTTGKVYFDQRGVRINQGGGESSSTAPIISLDLTDMSLDTVAQLPVPPPASGGGFRMSGGGGNVQIRGGLSPMAPRDVWAVAPDGRIAVVHADPYQVEWFGPEGTVTGPPVQYEPVRVTDNDKEAWADALGGGAAVMMTSGGAGSGTRTMRVPRPDPDEQEWPEFKPPFPNSAASVTPDGDLWVQRHVAFGEPALYDVFDRAGRLTRRVELSEGRSVVGFGDGKLYAVNTDEDDLQWLEVYSTARP
jgi:hypothetical protein